MKGLSYYNNSHYVGPYLLYKIRETIEQNKGYAIKLHKSRASDVISMTYAHAIANYKGSPEGETLQGYILSLFKTIYMKDKDKNNSMDDEHLYHFVDTLNMKENADFSPTETLIISSSEEDCLIDFMPYIVLDYEFFLTLDKNKCKCDYSSILSTYDAQVILNTLNKIKEEYLPGILSFIESAKSVSPYKKVRTWQQLANKSLSSGEFLGKVGDIVLVSGGNKDVGKCFSVDIEDYTNFPSPLTHNGIDYFWNPGEGFSDFNGSRDYFIRGIITKFTGKRGVEYLGNDGDILYFTGTPDYGGTTEITTVKEYTFKKVQEG